VVIESFARRKLFHARVLARFSRHVENPWEAFRSFRSDPPLAEFKVRGGPTLRARREDKGAVLFWEVFVQRCYSPPGFYAPRRGDTIVDLGANIGTFVLYCQTRAPGVRVVAAEPVPATYAQLRRNVEANRLEAAVSTYSVAVSDHRGSLYLAPQAESGHNALVAAGEGEPIPCITLDDLFERAQVGRCDLLKIDTEGAEHAILEGASRGLWSRVRNIALEHHDAPASGGRIERFLTGLGYSVRHEPIKGYPKLGMLYATRRG